MLTRLIHFWDGKELVMVFRPAHRVIICCKKFTKRIYFLAWCFSTHSVEFFPNCILLNFCFGKLMCMWTWERKSVQRSSCSTSRKLRLLLSVCTYNFSLHICVYVGLCVLFQIYFSIDQGFTSKGNNSSAHYSITNFVPCGSKIKLCS